MASDAAADALKPPGGGAGVVSGKQQGLDFPDAILRVFYAFFIEIFTSYKFFLTEEETFLRFDFLGEAFAVAAGRKLRRRPVNQEHDGNRYSRIKHFLFSRVGFHVIPPIQ
jgi:hypothetical protein